MLDIETGAIVPFEVRVVELTRYAAFVKLFFKGEVAVCLIIETKDQQRMCFEENCYAEGILHSREAAREGAERKLNKRIVPGAGG